MEEIVVGGSLIGIRIGTVSKGSVPITDAKEFVQVVTLSHKRGAYLKAHTHRPLKRQTAKLQECMVVRKGKVRLDLYDMRKRMVKKVFLREGQAFILLNGGIGVHFLEDSEIIEVKNGPFKEDKELI